MRKRRKLQLLITFAALVIVAGVIMALTFGRSRELSALEKTANAALAPAVKGSYNASSGVKEFFQKLFGVRDVDKEFEELKKRLTDLEIEYQFKKDLEEENKRLTKLLGFQEAYPEYKYIHTSVMAKDPGSWFMTFTIDRGEKDGVKKNMAVANENGLVGRIIEVSANTSKVISIVDPQSAVAAAIERSRDTGITNGAMDPESKTPEVRLFFLPTDADLVPGDVVISSNLGGIYPNGLVIGTVKEVAREGGEYAVITPAVDFAKLQNLLIIVDKTPVEELLAQDTEDTTTETTENQEANNNG